VNTPESIFVAGHRGLVGSALVRRLQAEGTPRLLLRTRAELDLTSQPSVEAFFKAEKPQLVYLAAARVGGIHANETLPANFLYDNLMIQCNVVEAARRNGVRKLLFLGSSCSYPRLAPQPMSESSLLAGPLEPTNEWYAIAKIAGIKMCQAYRKQYGLNAICAMPTNLYGPGDNFNPQNSHVLPALMRRFHEANARGDSEVIVWGSGNPRREFLHVDDLADALVFLMRTYDGEEIVNIGWGKDITIRELAQLIQATVGYHGAIKFDRTKSDGSPRKLLNTSRLEGMGWSPRVSLVEGLRSTYEWFLHHRTEPQA
jgi:GDP-L-fucose synthase